MKKKLMSVLLAAAMVASMAVGCGSDKKASSDSGDTKKTESTEKKTESNQILFNGSSTLAPVITSMATTFFDTYGTWDAYDSSLPKEDIAIYVSAGGSGQGTKAVIDGTSTFGMVARSVKDEEKEAIRAIVEKLPYTHLSLEGWDGNATDEKFNSPVWETLYKPCLACGTCTFVCPTCQCYDIKDYDTGHGVKRYRCWDSCMYSDFTMMAHGNNRTSQMQRFRQRFMHKLVYFPANNDGMYSCVGCGRCVEKCPSSLNIVKVIKAFEKHGGEK